MSNPLVSVVIATYNSGAYLKDAIDSVLRQTVSDLEVLVIDDGSTDGTRDLVAGYSDPRLTYAWQANAGQTSAKNHGISKARGRFIGFCDGDDYWYPNKLELQLPLFERSRVGVVYSPSDTIDDNGKQLGLMWYPAHRGSVTAQLFMRNFIPFGTAVVRRECLDQVGPFDSSLRMGIDWDLWLRISAHHEFDFTSQSTYAYRIWSGQMSRNWRGRYSAAFEIMDKFMREHPGLISTDLKRKAFADNFANRARLRSPEQPLGAVIDAAKAVMFDPMETFCWKTLARTVVDATTVGRTRGSHAASPEKNRFLKNTLAPLALRLTAKSPRIFTYHRFSDRPNGRALHQEEFRWQMRYLKERCEVLPLSELLDQGAPSGPKPLAAVTVDDGYADFYDFAFPILQELGIRATVFVTTGFIDRQLHLWPDLVRALLQSCVPGSYSLQGYWRNLAVELHTGVQVEAAWDRLAEELVGAPRSARDAAIADLSASLRVPLESLDMLEFQAMTWEQLRVLRDAGFEIADHSLSHPCLPLLSDVDLRAELADSKALLERMLGSRVRCFAYPNGTHKDVDDRVVEAVRQLGYEYAVLSTPTPLDRARRFDIGRLTGETDQEHFRRLVQGFGLLLR